MVKVLTTLPPVTGVVPKSVWSVVDGVVSPEAMDVELPWISISGARVVKDCTPP